MRMQASSKEIEMDRLYIALFVTAVFALAGCSTTRSISGETSEIAADDTSESVAGSTGKNASAGANGIASDDSSTASTFTKGKIRGNIYTARDKSFSVAVPHKKEGLHEYSDKQIREELTEYGAYVSFGPAAFDESIYRVEIVKDSVSGVKTDLDDIAPKLIEDYKTQLQKNYASAPRRTKSQQETINGKKAYYWELTQLVPVGKYASNKVITITHDVYILNFEKGAAIVWVLIPETAKKAAIDSRAFAESVVIH